MTGQALLFLKDLAVVLGAAAVTTVVFRALRLPVALGYVLAGLLVGPHLPTGIDANPESIETLSELGITLLMFSVGLELSFRKLMRVGLSAFGTALIEVSFVVWVGYVAARFYGMSVREAIFAGAAIGISSTMLVAKVLEGARSPEIRPMVLGILVVEDLLAILLLALLAPVAQKGGLSAAEIGVEAGRLFAFLVVLVVGGFFVVPRIIRFVAGLQSPETLLVTSVGFCFSIAMAAAAFGYSVALGAFVAGALIAESGEGAAVEKLVHPLRDLFAAIFLVAVGMQIEPQRVAEQPWLAAMLVSAVVVGKTLGVTIGAVLTGKRLGLGLQAGIGLAQIGEFSFIIAALSLKLGRFGHSLYAAVVATSVLTALIAALTFKPAGRLGGRLNDMLPEALRTWLTFYGTWLEELSIAPNRNATVVRRALRSLVIDTVATSLVVVATSVWRKDGVALLMGLKLSRAVATMTLLAIVAVVALPFVLGVLRNARRLGMELGARVLPHAERGKVDLGASPRRAFVVTLQLLIVWALGVPIAALTQPFLPAGSAVFGLIGLTLVLAISFWRSATNLQGHVRAGAQVIVEAMRKQGREEAHTLERVQSVLPGFGKLVSLRLDASAGSVGKNLRDLNLRGVTGATVLAIRRNDTGVVPEPEEVLRSGDELVLAGTKEAIAAAREHLR